MPKEEKNLFEKLYSIDVGEHIEKKNGLNYLSWAYAWAEAKKLFPDINYTIEQFGENKLPYIYDENTGYMVFTSVTINGLTHDMWLPVMDGANKARKKKVYTYDTKWKKGVRVEPATMFDINTAIMRCLVKNIAMFGLGLYIFAGEDIPESVEDAHVVNAPKPKSKTKSEPPKPVENIAPKMQGELFDNLSEDMKAKMSDVVGLIVGKYPDKFGKLFENICAKYNVDSFFELTEKQLKEVEEKL